MLASLPRALGPTINVNVLAHDLAFSLPWLTVKVIATPALTVVKVVTFPMWKSNIDSPAWRTKTRPFWRSRPCDIIRGISCILLEL
jgi:hypothetical protein